MSEVLAAASSIQATQDLPQGSQEEGEDPRRRTGQGSQGEEESEGGGGVRRRRRNQKKEEEIRVSAPTIFVNIFKNILKGTCYFKKQNIIN